MALDDTDGLPNGKQTDGDGATASADDARIVLAQAESSEDTPTEDVITDVAQAGPGEDGVPIAEPGDPGPALELNPDQLATLLVALSQGQNIDEAMNDMLVSSLERANELGATPESITAAINAFRETLVNIVAEGLTAEEAVISADQAFFNALQVSQEQQTGEQQAATANALATGENVDEVIGENAQAFEEALQQALEGGADIGEALAAAEEAQAIQDQIDAELAAAQPGDALIAALASGENVEDTVGAVQGDGDPAAFEQALAAALDGGAELGEALSDAGQAAETASLVAAEQAADEANANPMLAALA